MRMLMVLMVVVGCSPHHRRAVNTGGLLVGQLSHMADFYLTQTVSNGGRWDAGYVEGNPLLGSRPSRGVLFGAAIVTTVGMALAYLLPDEGALGAVKTTFFVAFPVIETANVVLIMHDGRGVSRVIP
jgi:hypothetical protein